MEGRLGGGVFFCWLVTPFGLILLILFFVKALLYFLVYASLVFISRVISSRRPGEGGVGIEHSVFLEGQLGSCYRQDPNFPAPIFLFCLLLYFGPEK